MRRQGFCRSVMWVSLHLAGDDPRIVVLVAKAGEDGAGLRSKRHDPASSFGVVQLDAIVLDVLAAQELDLRLGALRRRT